MEIRRTLIIIGMAVVSYLLIMAWQRDYSPQLAAEKPAAVATENLSTDLPAAPVTEAKAETDNSDIPAPVAAVADASEIPAPATGQPSKGWIQVNTDVLSLSIDPVGGDIVRLSLPKYTKSVSSTEPFVLLENDASRTYVAQSGLVGLNGPDAAKTGRPVYHSAANSYRMEGDTLNVELTLPAVDGVEIRKIYHFTRGEYLVKVSYQVVNQGSQPWQGAIFAQLKRDSSKDPSSDNHSFGMVTFLGGAWWTPQKSYNKLALKKFGDEPVKETVEGGWAAMVQHYFVSAWIAEKGSKNHYSTRTDKAGNNIIGFTGPVVTVASGQSADISASFYSGPKIQKNLEAISEGLELTVDYGWLWFIAQILFWLLTKIQSFVGNWGWSIVLLTVLVKAAFFKLSASSYKSMANMRRVMPEMQRMKEQYGDDRQKMSQAMMELYRKEKINPLGGCLPILIQMPVFIALYWTLMESVELRHAPWIGWIHDLSLMDPYFVLPILMGITMWIQQHLNPAPPDPMQAKIMKLMPIVFTFMFLWFPAGLVLYWLVNNILSIAQQWFITRQIESAAAASKK